MELEKQKQDTILIVDDEEANRVILYELFKNQFRILQAEDGEEGLKLLDENKERLAVILLDLIMPKVSGFEFLENMRENQLLKQIPVVLITGSEAKDVEKRGFDMGASDVARKPFDVHIIRRRVQNVVDLYIHKNHLEFMVKKQTAELEEQAKKIRENSNFIIDTLSTVVEFRSLESGTHIMRIRGFTRVLTECVAGEYPEYELTPEKVELISSSSAMHDVGKIAIPDTILNKPGKLTAEEFEIMKTHTTKGCEIIESVAKIQDEEYSRYCYDIARYHHERYDGRGYPDGLAGEEIPIHAQIVSVADVYDALVSKRVYKGAYGKEEAYRMILNGECGTFSPKLLHCLELVKEPFEQLVDEE